MVNRENFKTQIEKFCELNRFKYKCDRSDAGGEWFSISLKSGLFEVSIASDNEVGINLPTEDDEFSFGGCDEAYSDFNKALKRVSEIIEINK